jgi:hypothetical protein
LRYTEGTFCSGFFDDQKGEEELRVAGGLDCWLEILVHEFGHFTQWAEGTDLWLLGDKHYQRAMKHINGGRVKDAEVSIDIAMHIELECEQRAVKLIKKHKLPLDIPTYIQGANTYMYYWKYIYEKRVWHAPDLSPVNDKVLNDKMPTRFLKSYNLTKKIRDEFDRSVERKRAELAGELLPNGL